MADSSQRAGTTDNGMRRATSGDQTTSWDRTVVSQPAFAVRSGAGLDGRILEIQPGAQVLGREAASELRLDDPLVSRRHAIVVRDEATVTIQDAGSANGTRVNGEQLLGDVRRLRSGDLVQVGPVDLVYLDGQETLDRRRALLGKPGAIPPAGEGAAPRDSAGPASGTRAADSLPLPLAPRQVAFGAVASAVTALVVAGLHVDRLGTSWVGSMGAAAATSVIATLLQTRGRGAWWRLAGGAGLAFALAVTGVSLPELGLHRSLTNSGRPSTFVPPALPPSTTSSTTATTGPLAGPRITATAEPAVCPEIPVGQAELCPVVTIRSTGAGPLLVRSFQLVGPAAADFQIVPNPTGTTGTTSTDATGATDVGGECQGRPLVFNEVCTVTMRFQPSEAGLRSATLIVHQNLPSPDTGTPVDLIGQGGTAPVTT